MIIGKRCTDKRKTFLSSIHRIFNSADSVVLIEYQVASRSYYSQRFRNDFLRCLRLESAERDGIFWQRIEI